MHASRLVLVARSSVNWSTHRRRRPIQGRRPMSPSALSPVRAFLLLAAVGTLALAPTALAAKPTGGSGADNASGSKVEVRFDSGAYTPATGTSSWSPTIDASTAADGQHTVTARATDAAGNTSTSSVTVAIGSSGTAVQAPAMAPGTI